MKKCKNITFCHFFAFGGPCDVQKWVKVYKVYVSWKPCLYSLRRHQKKWFLSIWGRTRCNRSAQGLKMANCTSFKILTHIGISVSSVGRSGANLASRTTSSVFDQFSWNLAQMCALGCRCARHIFRQWQKECCHGNGILWQKWGEKSCVANYFLSFSPILMKFGTDVCLGV